MSTIPTDFSAATQNLIERVAPLSHTVVIPLDEVQLIAATHLPFLPERESTLVVLEIAQGLTHVALFESADEHWLAMFGGQPTDDLHQWGFTRADAWRELVYLTAANAVETNLLQATQVA